ncbi:hypothetical protein J9303_11600 [Bacillaceae bacterium Marseille-Q3522]|nr:hypothetical protein [Bacillaceae bacterium Marseille-Q3522]
MAEKITVIHSELDNEKIFLQVDENISLTNVAATGKMLVDSEAIAFVYIVEKNNEYVYILVTEDVWGKLEILLQRQLPVYLTNGNWEIVLDDFAEELVYLVDNIKGNGNYGEEMVAKVESSF